MQTEQLYADANGILMTVVGELTDPVRLVPQGGGFSGTMPLAKFKEHFKPVQGKLPFKAARFDADWLPNDFLLEGYTDGRRWNGWAMPYLRLDQAQRLLAHMPDLRYDAGRDAFIQTIAEYDPPDNEDVFEACWISVDGHAIKVYAIGAGSWCWDMTLLGATPAQLEQMEATLANDEASSDEELLAFFTNECGVPEEAARKAVSHRGAFLATAIPEKGLLAKLMAKSDD